MIKFKEQVKFFTTIFVVLMIRVQASSSKCNQTCGNNRVQYPFGFSDECLIRLNCSSSGQIFINMFPVGEVTEEGIKIAVQPKCDRRIESLRPLFSENYAPKFTNAVLLYNCSANQSFCNIPGLNVQTHFEHFNCSSKSRISCFSQMTSDGLFNYENMTRTTRCRYVLSSISMASNVNVSGTSLEVQVMELQWWVPGSCNCSKDADCLKFPGASSRPGFRCRCRNGFVGDGYQSGTGCTRVDSNRCNLQKYLSGKCGGATRYVVLFGGIVTGAILMIIFGLFCCFIQRRSTTKTKDIKNHRFTEASGINIPVFPYREIEKATNSFCEKQRLGTGAYGTVYAGKLQNDLWVAIKRIKQRDTGSIEQVINEIKLISSVSHPNLVRLLGCTLENEEQILVYEFMPNGTLCQHLHWERGDGLAWPIRLAIVAETARAIAHLHSAMDPPIYHRDIKSSNILLDYNFRSKVADFGLSRFGMTETSHISTAPQGTPGYVDPQYHQNFHLSDKSDVYSFGVVLIEIITAMKVVDFSRQHNEVNLAALAIDRIGKGKLEEIIDPFVDPHSDAWIHSSIHEVAELAFRCLAFDRDMRPSMTEVAEELEKIRLSLWTPREEINCSSSNEESTSSSSSNGSVKPLSFNNDDLGKSSSLQSQRENLELLSEKSSTSSKSLLNNSM